MNDFLHAQYEQSRSIYLENLAYMQGQNEQYAEQNGGKDNLPEAAARIYKGREARIIRLVAYHDRAQEYIADLQEWVDKLIRENRSLATQVKDARTGWQKFFPNMTNRDHTETDREYRRHMSITQLQIEQPDLF